MNVVSSSSSSFRPSSVLILSSHKGLIGSTTNAKLVSKLPKEDPWTLSKLRLSEMSNFLLTDFYMHSMFRRKSGTRLRNSYDKSWRFILSTSAKSSPHDCYSRGLMPSHGFPLNVDQKKEKT